MAGGQQCRVGADARQASTACALLFDTRRHTATRCACTPSHCAALQPAPASSVPCSVSTGQMVAAQRALGFDYVFDTDFSADLTIMEEGESCDCARWL